MDRSRSPHRDSFWIAKQVAMLGRYSEKRPKDLRITADGHIYLEDLMQAWGKPERLDEHEVLSALRKHAIRQVGDEIEQRFSIMPTIKGRTLIRVAPKNQSRRKIGPREDVHLRLGAGAPRARPRMDECKHECKEEQRPEPHMVIATRVEPKKLATRDKLEMSLSDLIRAENDTFSSVRSTYVARPAPPVGLAAPVEPVATGTSTMPNSIEDQRFGRVRRSMEQMGLTPSSAHVRSQPRRKAADSSEVVDLSPSPPRSNGATVVAQQGQSNLADDAVDAVLAARVAECCKVSGEIEIRDASGDDAGKDPPPKPPGANWEQYIDDEHGDVWYYWPGPGGQWWCGCNEDDVPKPYNEEGET